MRDNFAIASFPALLGAIDCTHVAIQSPGGPNAELYGNRKGYFSLNVQAVSTSKLIIEDIVTRWLGSSHDSTIFSNSRLCARFETGQIPSSFLLGDARYPCNHQVDTLANPITFSEQRYNAAQIKTRNPIERTFGVLKRR